MLIPIVLYVYIYCLIMYPHDKYYEVYHIPQKDIYITRVYRSRLYFSRDTLDIPIDIQDYIDIDPDFSDSFPCLIFQTDPEECDFVEIGGEQLPSGYSRKKQGDNIIFCQGSTYRIIDTHESEFDFEVFSSVYGTCPDNLSDVAFPGPFDRKEFLFFSYVEEDGKLNIRKLEPVIKKVYWEL